MRLNKRGDVAGGGGTGSYSRDLVSVEEEVQVRAGTNRVTSQTIPSDCSSGGLLQEEQVPGQSEETQIVSEDGQTDCPCHCPHLHLPLLGGGPRDVLVSTGIDNRRPFVLNINPQHSTINL